MKTLGFFGGTFDPIHFGHLNLAINLLERRGLDHILFSPANFSPEKETNRPMCSNTDRKKMVELAIGEIPQFSLFDYELEKEGPSYTIDAVKFLKKKYPNAHLHLILGEDLLFGLPRWKNIDELITLAPPFVGSRINDLFPTLPPMLEKAVERGRTEIPMIEISSTQVRERLFQKKYCGHIIPAKVLDYIEEKGLYS